MRCLYVSTRGSKSRVQADGDCANINDNDNVFNIGDLCQVEKVRKSVK